MTYDNLFPDGLSASTKLTAEQIKGIHKAFNDKERYESCVNAMTKRIDSAIKEFNESV